MSNQFKIQLEADKHPASFTAFDILYYKDHPIVDMTLMEREEIWVPERSGIHGSLH